jgi:hypothetical protein
MIGLQTSFRSSELPRPVVACRGGESVWPKLRCFAFFVFCTTYCILASFSQEIVAPAATATPTPTPAELVDPGVNVNGTLSPIIVIGREDSLIGIAGSASEGTVGQDEITERPILRPGEVMETIPGMIVTQHAGGGKANQYFLRGFNLDHGTDFATDFNGVPINLPTHAHGEGYTDLNFLIPELVQRVDYAKGPYYAQYGDFASAGAADLQYVDRLPQNITLGTVGQYGYYRGLLAVSHTIGENDLYGYNGQDRVVPAVNPGTFLGAIEAFHNDGPWDPPENFRKLNLVLRYSQGSATDGFSLMLNGYSGAWTGEQQIPERAIRHDDIGYFGNLDPSDGGDSQRYMFTAEWHGQLTDNSYTKAILYCYYYDLDLFSDFTYFLDNPTLGDQFEQKDQRIVSGLTIDHKITDQWFGRDIINDFGLQVRNDYVMDIALNHTHQRNVYAQLTDDRVIETSISEYYENRIQFGDWFRTVAGVRGDFFAAEVTDKLGGPNGGTASSFLASPKLQMVFGPWFNTELYLDGGFGFHSNDARGTTSVENPAAEGGGSAAKVPLLVQQRGAEVGVRSTAIPHLQTTFALWYLASNSELVFDGDTGDTEPTPASKRYGIEFSNYYTPLPWLTLNADYAWSNARYPQSSVAGQFVPEAVEQVFDAGISFHDLYGFEADLRFRYFGPRALTQDDSVRSPATALLYVSFGYRFNPTWNIKVDIFNLLNARADDIAYYYASRLKNEPPGPDGGGYNDVEFHPAEPRSVRVTLTARF